MVALVKPSADQIERPNARPDAASADGDLVEVLREIRDRLPPRPPAAQTVGAIRGASRRVHSWVKAAEPWGILCAVAALGLTLWSLQEERLAREEDRINRAWSLVAAAKVDGAGNIGQIDALETLATRRTDLSRIKLRGAYLEKIHLAGAQLGGADLSHAILALADLSGSKLDGTSFVSSLLSIANLAYADLSRADFTNADLSKRQTSLCNADLRQFRWRQLTLPLCDAHDPGKTRQGCPLRTILFGRPMG
jgi:hypothetical protein